VRRHELSDEEWKRIEPLLPAERGRKSRPAKLSNRTFMNAVFYLAKTGAPWRDLPERFGPWKTVHAKFSRWNARKVFDRILALFAQDADNESSMADSSYVRAHCSSPLRDRTVELRHRTVTGRWRRHSQIPKS